MNFEFTAEQLEIQKTARELAQEVLAPKASEYDEKEQIPEDNYAKLKELGFMGMCVPEQYGGPGFDYVSYTLAMIEFSKACASTATMVSVSNSLVNDIMLKFGSEELKKAYLPRVCSGEIVGAFSLSEPEAGSDAGNTATMAVDKGDHWVINGVKNFTTGGQYADFIIVFAQTDRSLKHKGIFAIIADKGITGFTVGKKESKLGLRASDTTQLVFEDCIIPKNKMLGNVGDGFKVAMTALDGGRIGIAAQAIGIAEAALNESVKYSQERKQFDQAICNFQAIQDKLAEMAMRIDASKLLTLRAAWLRDKGHRVTKEGAMAKLYASQTANWVTYQAVQIHGGYGYIKEYNVERYFRDARITEIYEGTSEIQRLVIAREVLKGS